MSPELCPSPDELSEFLSGTLDSVRSDWIETHIDVCATCGSQLAALHCGPDPLLLGLKQESEDSSLNPSSDPISALLVGEPEYLKALSELVQLRAEPSADDADLRDASDRVPLHLRNIREYRLLEPIGRGGMGMVYRAEHTRLKRQVALKILPSERLTDPQALSRFEREMEAVGRLDHSNIVRATDAGEIDGTHFLVMDLVDGPDIARVVKTVGQLNIADACEIVCQAAEGLQHVHEHGLVHRDIKPSNLLLTRDGKVRVLDLGLALLRSTEDVQDEELTTTGQIMGTADYIAPEQAMSTHTVDIRADIYSLGCTLYHLLTGQPPFRNPNYSNAVRKMMAHANDTVPPPTDFRQDLSPELVAVLDKMLDKTPANRPATPRQVALALKPFTSGADLETLSLRVAGDRTQPLAERGSTVFPMSSAISDTAGNRVDHADAHPELEETNLVNSRGRRGKSRWTKRAIALRLLPVIGLLSVIVVMTGNGRLELTVNSPDVKVTIDDEPQQIEVVSNENGRFLIRFPVNAGRHEMIVSKDGFGTETKHFWLLRGTTREFEALLTPVAATGGMTAASTPSKPDTASPLQATSSAWDVLGPAAIPEAERIPQLPREVVAVLGSHRQRHWSWVVDVAIRPDGKQAATAGSDGIRFWDLETFEQTAWLNGRDHGIHHVGSLAYTADSRRLLASHQSIGFLLTVIDCSADQPVVVGHPKLDDLPSGNLMGLEISKSGRFVSGSHTTARLGVLWEWNGETLREVTRISMEAPMDFRRPIVLSPDERMLCVVNQAKGEIHLHEVQDGRWTLQRTISALPDGGDDKPVAPLLEARFAPDGRLGIVDGKGRLWFYDVSNEEPRVLFDLDKISTPFRFSADGQTLLTHRALTGANIFDVWSLDREGAAHRLANSPLPAGSISLSRDNIGAIHVAGDGQLAMTGHNNGLVRFWDLSGDTLREHSPVRPNYDPYVPIVHLTGEVGFRKESPESVWVTPSATGLNTAIMAPDTDEVDRWPLAASPDQSRLVTGGRGGTALIRERRGGHWRTVRSIEAGADSVGAAALSQDHSRLATGTAYPHAVDLWDLSSPIPTRLSHLNLKGVGVQLAFALDDSLLIVLNGGTAKVFQVKDKELEELPVPGLNDIPAMRSIAVSQDGRELATASNDRVDLWSLTESGVQHVQQIHHSMGTNRFPNSVSYAPDGHRLAFTTDSNGGGLLTIRNVRTGRVEHNIDLPGPAYTVRYLDDSRHILTRNANGTIYILRPGQAAESAD